MNQVSPSSDEPGVSLFLSVDQVAHRYNVSVDSIWRWKRNGKFPKPVRIGGCTRWKLSDILEFDNSLVAAFATSYSWSRVA